jgi:hypothetical protein
MRKTQKSTQGNDRNWTVISVLLLLFSVALIAHVVVLVCMKLSLAAVTFQLPEFFIGRAILEVLHVCKKNSKARPQESRE